MKALNRIGNWSLKQKIIVFYVLPHVVWLVIGIIPLTLLDIPFSAVDYYSAVVFTIPGILGIVTVIYPAPFVEIYFKVQVPVYDYVSKRLSKSMHTEVESRLFFWDLGVFSSRRATRLYFRIVGMVGVVFSFWVVKDIISHV